MDTFGAYRLRLTAVRTQTEYSVTCTSSTNMKRLFINNLNDIEIDDMQTFAS
jgi:hypothetical protein